MYLTRNVLIKYRNPADGEGNDLGGAGRAGGTGEGAGEGQGDGEGDGAGDAGDANKGDPKQQGEKKPTDAEARLLKEVMDKKSKLKSAEDRAKELEARLKEFEGIDVEGVRKMLSEKQAEETRKLEEKGQWDSLKKQMAEEHSKEKSQLEAALTERDSILSQLRNQIAELTVGTAFASSAFIKEDMTIPVGKARVLYSGHFEFKDGQVVAYDKASGADRSVLVDAQGEPLGFEAAIKKIIESDPDRDSLLKSKVRNGAGSKTTAKPTTPDQKVETLTGAQRIAAALGKAALKK